MSEFIMGLGISVKICSLYEELVCLSICDSEHTLEFYLYIEKLKKLIDDETLTYDKLSDDDIVKYFNRINEEDTNMFDSVKSRYYSKLKERNELLNDDLLYQYPFTIDTAISGKILMDALVKVEKQFFDKDNNLIQNDSIYDLYSYHKTHRFTLLSSNDFLERIAIDFNFNLCNMPKINFERIKENFKYGDDFNSYLNKVLYLMSIELVNNLVYSNSDLVDVYNVYANMLCIAELEVIISYLNKQYLNKLVIYCNINNINSYINGKYVEKILKKYK